MSYCPLPVGAPAQRHQLHRVPVVKRVDEGPDLVSLVLDMTAYPGEYHFGPGQFNMLYAPGVGEAAISIASDPGRPELLEHTFAVVGRVTGVLGALQPGDRLWLRGPYGGAWPMRQMRGKHLLLVGGGIGVPPLMGIVQQALRDRHLYESVTLVAAAKNFPRLVYKDRYDALEAGGIDVRLTLDDAPAHWLHHEGLATDLLAPLPGPPGQTVMLTCGPEPMMRAVAEHCLALGMDEDHCYISTERTMNCAVGLCGRCQLGPHFTCLDGPVYPYAVLRQLMAVKHF